MAEETLTDNERDISPDSVFLTFSSHFHSLFSSSSASVDRSSSASSAATTTTTSLHIGGGDSGVGPDLRRADSNKIPAVNNNNNKNSLLCKKVEKAKVHLEDDNNVLLQHNHPLNDDEIYALDSGRSSFSLALKECQERRSRSEALARKLDRRRPASLDLNNNSNNSVSNINTCTINVISSSPRLGAMMKKNTITTKKSGNFPSPGTPNYRGVGGNAVNKGWSSERVAMPANGNRRQVGAALLPLNNNGRVLPSKWEDAERWIFSPVAGDGGGGGGSGRPSSCQQQHVVRRPKAKSGPLGAPGLAYYSMYSPALPMYEGGNMGVQRGGSPFSAGVMMAEGWSFRAGDAGGRGFGSSVEPCIARSMSVHGCTDLVCQGSLTSSQDEKNDDVKDSANSVSRAVSRRDMATQMSPEGSCHSSPRRISYSPSTPSILPIVEVQSYCSSKSEVRDVQIDERVTVTRWSKKHKGRAPVKGSEDVNEWRLKAIEPCSSSWEMSESVKSLSKSRREEAKITAWENLQKAKAEAAIRKLEMKLEKKRSSSIDKIMKKLRSAQKKAQEMRSAVLTSRSQQVSKPDNNAISLRRTRQMGSLSGCFTCHAF
ncbi:hypothetical protein RND81_01G099900 [Saponaria officinalis]|uniref:Remorin C-terminal domain-containing protein n=2 Tax=Saponaria officinalis TaxID=3572 RepID=A0AAW1NDW3_SAPOF